VRRYPFAGLRATARELQAAASDGKAATASRTFPISLAGLADCTGECRFQKTVTAGKSPLAMINFRGKKDSRSSTQAGRTNNCDPA
jgi:hypothetical protein